MKTINLRKFYGSVYKTDTFIELPDEIVDALESGERIEHYSGQKIREHTYSIDYSPEIEYAPVLNEIVVLDVLQNDFTKNLYGFVLSRSFPFR